MTPPRNFGTLLDRRQSAAVRESLRNDLGAHPEWADLWNLHGLLEAYEGNLEKGRASFAEALRRNSTYRIAKENLVWAGLLAGESATGLEDLDNATVNGVVRPLYQ